MTCGTGGTRPGSAKRKGGQALRATTKAVEAGNRLAAIGAADLSAPASKLARGKVPPRQPFGFPGPPDTKTRLRRDTKTTASRSSRKGAIPLLFNTKGQRNTKITKEDKHGISVICICISVTCDHFRVCVNTLFRVGRRPFSWSRGSAQPRTLRGRALEMRGVRECGRYRRSFSPIMISLPMRLPASPNCSLPKFFSSGANM